MKKKDVAELVRGDMKSLGKQVAELSAKLAMMSVSRYTIQSKNTRESKMLRRKMAVIKTILRQKELSYEPETGK